MRDVAVIGAGMTNFGKFLDRSMKDIAGEAVKGALDSAGVDKSKLEAAVVGNATAGLITGQEMIRGQVVLREMGIGGIPVINTENACASSSTAFHVAWMYVASGMYDMALAVGMEKLYHEDKTRSFKAIGSAVDVEWVQQMAAAAKIARRVHMRKSCNTVLLTASRRAADRWIRGCGRPSTPASRGVPAADRQRTGERLLHGRNARNREPEIAVIGARRLSVLHHPREQPDPRNENHHLVVGTQLGKSGRQLRRAPFH